MQDYQVMYEPKHGSYIDYLFALKFLLMVSYTTSLKPGGKSIKPDTQVNGFKAYMV